MSEQVSVNQVAKKLRSPANVFYEYAADGGALLREAADEIDRLEAESEDRKRSLARAAEAGLALTAENAALRKALERIAEPFNTIGEVITISRATLAGDKPCP